MCPISHLPMPNALRVVLEEHLARESVGIASLIAWRITFGESEFLGVVAGGGSDQQINGIWCPNREIDDPVLRTSLLPDRSSQFDRQSIEICECGGRDGQSLLVWCDGTDCIRRSEDKLLMLGLLMMVK